MAVTGESSIETRENGVAPHAAIPRIDRRGTAADERRLAVLKTLEIIGSVSRGLRISDGPHGNAASWRLL